MDLHVVGRWPGGQQDAPQQVASLLIATKRDAPVFFSGLLVKEQYSHPLLSTGVWFHNHASIPNPCMLKSLV